MTQENAEAVFAAWAVRVEAGEALEFEDQIREHAALADDLRKLHDDWKLFAPLLGKVVPGLIASDTGIVVSPLSGSGDDAAEMPTSELLDRLGIHAPNSGRYRFRAVLGRGGGGVVLKVWDTKLNRPLAMKVVLGRGEARPTGDTPRVDGRTLTRFVDEARIASQLNHPGIVPVHELGADETGRAFFTMKLVKGEDLSVVFEHVKTGVDGWNQTRVLGVLQRVCEAMAFAHDKGVIHRDLKPANIMVGRYGEVHVMDWGLARVLGEKDRHDIRIKRPSRPQESVVDSLRASDRAATADSPLITMDGDAVGTPSYMSPEQANGDTERIGPRSDIYAVGAMLYQLIAGQAPYLLPGAPVLPLAIWMRVKEGPARPILELAPRAPSELIAIGEKAMARDPSQRYADMRALAEDLRAYLERRVVSAYETGTWAETRKWVQRNRPLAASIAAALLIAVAGSGWIATKDIKILAQSEEIGAKNIELSWSNEQLLEARKRADAKAGEAVAASMRAEETAANAKRQEDLARASEARAQQQSYFANIIAADASLQAHEVIEARRRLNACDEALRGWEWRYLHLAMDTSLAVLRGHANIVTSVAFSPDGLRIASASFDNTIRVSQSTSDETLLVLTGDVDNVFLSVAFSPDGTRLAAASSDKTVRVWDSTTGEMLLILRGHTSDVHSVAFSPDGTRIASGSHDGMVYLWSATTGDRLLTVRGTEHSDFAPVAFSPDGSHIASALPSGSINIVNVVTGEISLTLRGQDPEVTSVAFSPDGSRIAASSYDKTVRVWDVNSGESLFVLKHDAQVQAVAFSPDGSRIASAPQDKTIHVWNATSGLPLSILRGHSNMVTSIAFSSDGLRIASGSWDDTVRIWDAGSGESLSSAPGSGSPVESVAFSPDGARIASGLFDKTVRVWNAASTENTLVLQGHTDRVRSVAFSPDSTRIASGSDDKTVRVWDATHGGSVLVLEGHQNRVTSVAFSSNGSQIASASDDRSVRVWDATSGKSLLVLQGHEAGVSAVAFSPDGSHLASGSDTVRVWDAMTGERLLVLQGHEAAIHAVAFSPDGSRIASASVDRTVRVWSAISGENLLVLRGHDSNVFSVAFSPDGLRIASASSDTTIRVWNANSGESLLVLRGHDAMVFSVAFSPDASRIASASYDGTVRLWETAPSAIHDPARQAEAAGACLVQSLFARFGLVDDVVRQLQADPSLRADVRSVGLRLAGAHENDPELMIQGIQFVLDRTVHGDPSAYAHAARVAQVACDMAPENGYYLNILGVTQYRLGEYEKALSTLTRSDELNGGAWPADAAFIAMANHRLEKVNAAQAALARLREIIQDPDWSESKGARSYLTEAETLMAGPSAPRATPK